MSELLTDFHFLRPAWLLAIPIVCVLWWLLLRTHKQATAWQQWVAPHLLPALMAGRVSKASKSLMAGLLALWCVVCLVLAGPVWHKLPSPVVEEQNALVICWDLSPSMLAQDITPSRLERSRLKIIDLLNARQGGQSALIAYAGEAYTVTPLTDDIRTITNLLPALGPTSLPSVGSNPEMAFEMANDLLKQAGVARGQIVLLTDEITLDAQRNLEPLVQSSPHKLTLWGIGTTDGAPIPLPQGGFAKDASGAIAVAKLNEDSLQRFAGANNSYYVPVVNNNTDVDTLLQLLERKPSQDEGQSEQTFDQWAEYGHWLLIAMLPFVALGFRRGWLMVWFLVPLSITPPTADASPFKRADQKGYEAFQNGEYEQAAEHFERPDWQGAALYEQGKYAEAAAAFKAQGGAEGLFNAGNAELLAGNVDGAIEQFKQSLEVNPDNENAKKNLALAEALKEQQEQQQDQQNQNSQDNQNGESQDQNQQDQNSSEQNNQQNSESQSEQQSGEQTQNAQNSSNSGDSEQADAKVGSSDGNASSAAAMQAEQSGGSASSEALAGQQSSGSASSTGDQQALMAAEQSGEREMTEEEQRLEAALRKVPDDPSGLLRAKFNYEYRKRQQELRRGFNETEQAEQRW